MRKVLIILGVPIDDLTMPAALDRIDEFIVQGRATGKTHQIATVNADFAVKALDDPELRLILQECDMATADGMPLVWGARLLGVRLEGRVTGADLVPALAERAARKGYSLYLLGGAPGVAQSAASILQTRYPGLEIAGIFSPPLSSVLEMDDSVAQNIRAAKPDILLVAFGNPKQEKWIHMHARDVPVPVMIGVGGTFDFIAGKTKRAPAWMQKAGLEWIFRLAQEPRRLWKRYVIDLGGFGIFFIRQWLALRGGRTPHPIVPQTDIVLVADHAVVTLTGRLDANNATPFAENAQRALDALGAQPRLIVNLARATFLDSRGLGVLVTLAKRARDANGDLYLVAVPAALAQTLKLTRLDKFFETFPTIEHALKQRAAASEPLAAPNAPRGAWLVIAAPRRLDTNTAPEFLERCLESAKANPRLTLDLTGTVFLASAGMAALLKLHKQTREAGGELRLAGCASEVARALELARLNTVLHLFPNVETATAK